MTDQFPSQMPKPNDAPPVEEVLKDSERHDAKADGDLTALSEEIASVRAEIDRITASVGLLADSADEALSETPANFEERLRVVVQERPLAALFGTVALSYGLTRHWISR